MRNLKRDWLLCYSKNISEISIGEQQMKIIFCRWNSICEVGITTALERLGHEIIPLDRRFTSVDYDKEYLLALSQVILTNPDADLVFSVNFMPIIARVCDSLHKLYYSWIVDSPCFQLYSETLRFQTNRVFLFDHAQYLKFSGQNPACIFYFPLGCDMPLYETITVNDKDHAMFDCDVSFVGSLYSEKCIYNNIEKDLPDYIRGYAEGLIHAQMQVYGYNFLEDVITEDFARAFKQYADWLPLQADYEEDLVGIVADTYIGQKCTEQERIKTFQAIGSHFSLDLWTQSDTSMLPMVHVRGAADSRTMMPKIIKCSKINLNLTNRPIKTGLPLRIFDILGCGGFLISNYQAEIPQYFVPDQDLVLYESVDDLLSKIAYYLKHDEERDKIAQSGYQKVKEHYSYEKRLQKMFAEYPPC